MARFCPLFSSSSGNCIYVGGPDGGLLVDAGASAKQIRLTLQSLHIELSQIQGVLVTHEHSDHIKGLRVLAGSAHLPVFASAGTLSALEEKGELNGRFPVEVIRGVMEIGGMRVKPFHTPHDSRESLGFVIETSDNRRVAIATDLGTVTQEVLSAITGADLVLLESNHELMMLENGSYPYMLKQRIKSDLGHLSNTVCAETARQLIQTGTSRFVLGHLSRENNTPDNAYQTTYAALSELQAQAGRDYILEVARVRDPACVTVF